MVTGSDTLDIVPVDNAFMSADVFAGERRSGAGLDNIDG
jgi:hypothetical protein